MVPWADKKWPILHTDWLSKQTDRLISPARDVLVFPTGTDFVCLFVWFSTYVSRHFAMLFYCTMTTKHKHASRKIHGSLSVIMLPLCSASLIHKNPQKTQNNLCMHPIGRKDRLIDLKMFLVEHPVCVLSVAVLVAIVKWRLCLLVFVVFYNRRTIFLFQ